MVKTFRKEGIVPLNIDLNLLKEDSLSSLNSGTLSHAYYFYLSEKFKRPFLLLRAGELITSDFIQKWKNKGLEKIYKFDIADQVFINEGKILFEQFRDTNDEFEKSKLAQDITIKVSKHLSLVNSKSLLDLSILMHSLFKFDINELNLLYQSSTLVFQRSQLQASLMVLFAMHLGYADYLYLQDIYHLTLFSDRALYQEALDFSILEKLKNDKTRLTIKQQEVLKFHTISAANALGTKFEREFHYPEAIDILRRHHELLSGEGYPYGINNSELTDIERLLIIFEARTPYDEFYYSQGDLNQLAVYFCSDESENVSSFVTSFFKSILANGSVKEVS